MFDKPNHLSASLVYCPFLLPLFIFHLILSCTVSLLFLLVFLMRVFCLRVHIFSSLLLYFAGCLSFFLRNDIVFDRISSLLLSYSSSLSRPSTHVIIYIYTCASFSFLWSACSVCVCVHFHSNKDQHPFPQLTVS